MKNFFVSLFFFSLVYLHSVPICQAISDQIYKDLATFTQILEIIDKKYVESPKEKELIVGAINGMLSTLDPHTVYFPPEAYKEFKTDTSGRFGGVGIEVTIKDGILTIVTPIEGSPAYDAGVKPGDRILSIAGKSTKNMSLMDSVKVMRGPIGKSIDIVVLSEGSHKPKKITITRRVIQINSVKVEDLGGGYGYFRITAFQEGTSKDFKKAVQKFVSEDGKELRGILLDLRDNPGGLLTEAAMLSNFFVKKGVIVSTKGRAHEQEILRAKANKAFLKKIPVVVLINGGSASAAEIVAGALQDLGRAKLFGEKSFGKGSVQTVLNLSNGAAIKITIAHYFTPKNRMIDGKGIEPDYLVDKKALLKKMSKTSDKSQKDKSTEDTSEKTHPKPGTREFKDALRELQKQQAISYLKKL